MVCGHVVFYAESSVYTKIILSINNKTLYYFHQKYIVENNNFYPYYQYIKYKYYFLSGSI
jgi:hypothetical protein